MLSTSRCRYRNTEARTYQLRIDQAITCRRLVSAPRSSRARGWVSASTPPRRTPLESSRHLTMKSMAKRDSRPARCMHIEATPSGQGRVVHAHVLRYHVARGSSSGGAGAQGRGPLESIPPCYAIQSFHDCLLGESGDHVGQGQPLCKWVSSSALSRVSEPRPPKRPPTRRLLLPRTGLAHGN